jgi:hypothetical protein
MTPSTLYLPKVVSRGDRLAALRAADWLSLGAAPIFAFMAALTGILGGGAHEMLCSAASHTSALSGMVPMYVLMSTFHFASWLKLISRWRSGARAAGLTHEDGM